MATKNKKIETRLNPSTYEDLKNLAEEYGVSIYEMTQMCIYWGIAGRKGLSKDKGYRVLSCIADGEIYKKLTILADELGVNIPTLVWSSLLYTMKRKFPHIKWE